MANPSNKKSAKPSDNKWAVMGGIALNVEYTRKYGFDATGAAKVNAKLVAVPPPSLFQEAVQADIAGRAKRVSGRVSPAPERIVRETTEAEAEDRERNKKIEGQEEAKDEIVDEDGDFEREEAEDDFVDEDGDFVRDETEDGLVDEDGDFVRDETEDELVDEDGDFV